MITGTQPDVEISQDDSSENEESIPSKKKKHQIRTFDNEEEFDDWINKEPNWTRWSRCIHVNIIEDGALNV